MLQCWCDKLEVAGEAWKMKFIMTYAATLIVCYIFMFFGGWMLFDFSERIYVATAACAFIIAVVLSVFSAQERKIEQLEKRIEELEEQKIKEHREKR